MDSNNPHRLFGIRVSPQLVLELLIVSAIVLFGTRGLPGRFDTRANPSVSAELLGAVGAATARDSRATNKALAHGHKLETVEEFLSKVGSPIVSKLSFTNNKMEPARKLSSVITASSRKILKARGSNP